jgi:hypothetical protein
MEEKKL